MNWSSLWLESFWNHCWQLSLLIIFAAVVTRLIPNTSARFRYGIWLVVLVKVFLPPLVQASWSLDGLIPLPGSQVISSSNSLPVSNRPTNRMDRRTDQETAESVSSSDKNQTWLNSRNWLLSAWICGMVIYSAGAVWQQLRVQRTIADAADLDEGPVRVLLEEVGLALHLKLTPSLKTSEELRSPFLAGVIAPTIVIPESLLTEFSPEELKHVFWHELIHLRRKDLLIAWAQSIAQGLFWFHPLVWWANYEIREAREASCDEIVLLESNSETSTYGNTIVRVLTCVQGRSEFRGSIAGIFERGAAIQQRLEKIMNFDKSQATQWKMWLGMIAFAVIGLPVAPASNAQSAAALPEDAALSQDDAKGNEGTNGRETPYPVIIATAPENFATDVDPDLDVISVTFDRPMQDGMSWTGGPPLFPNVDKSRKPKWQGNTCLLPVKLEKATYYRIGLNSTSHKNFASTDKTALPPAYLCFVTAGAKEAVEKRVTVPQIVAMIPENGAENVDPNLKSIQVTFDVPMGPDFSWTGGGAAFPKLPDGEKPRWSRDKKTCILPVELDGGHSYQLGLNSLSFNNFQSQWGVSLEPVVYEFTTRK